MHMFGSAVRHQASLVVGLGQGGLVALLSLFPLLLETACRSRVATAQEISGIRRAWDQVAGVVAVNPLMLPQRSEVEELQDAVPEIKLDQPRLLPRIVL